MLFQAIISIARPAPSRNSAVHSANIIRLQEAIFSVVSEPIAETERVSTFNRFI
jgi:hypothetical protein